MSKEVKKKKRKRNDASWQGSQSEKKVDCTGFEPVTFHRAHLQEMRSENHTPRPTTLDKTVC